jgi:hypothetical protein
MKIVELLNNLHLPITNEESDLLDQFDEDAIIFKRDLNDRQQILANQLVIKEVLQRKNQNGKIFYTKKNKR